ncbi:E3 ubiquitin-protein ligase DMA2 [Smittium mucronatum]|uniref:E3 ubiquitin-protein ligase DMA2 n=1 Tax=Smittium mucronatum TaxID=133383 RepID=A0A1R0GM63_9FUNG|nr:E3 ubiquitin-protein ligase DMA2 [Smittium mucronatum]
MYYLNPVDGGENAPQTHSLDARPSAAPSVRSQTAASNPEDLTHSTSSEAGNSDSISKKSSKQIPHIRIAPHIVDVRQCLYFEVIDRQVPEGLVVKVGRFTDKVSNQQTRIAFKSKVVSRSHAEIWTENGNFFIRDTKSSSGTFLNSMRLSPPGVESVPFPLKDGDILQLGVDYQGGTLDIYKCVKIRVEINRKWQRTKGNNFRKQILKNIQNSYYAVEQTKPNSSENTECCICLYNMLAFQALFVSPCSHCFHFKCVKQLLFTSSGFSCPLCRTYADLEASVSDDEVVEEEDDEDNESVGPASNSVDPLSSGNAPTTEARAPDISCQLPLPVQIVQSQFSNSLSELANNSAGDEMSEHEMCSNPENSVPEHVSNTMQDFQNELERPAVDSLTNIDTNTNVSDSFGDFPLDSNTTSAGSHDIFPNSAPEPNTPPRLEETTTSNTAIAISQNGASTPISTINNLNQDHIDNCTPVGSLPSSNILSPGQPDDLPADETDDCISHRHRTIIENPQTTSRSGRSENGGQA